MVKENTFVAKAGISWGPIRLLTKQKESLEDYFGVNNLCLLDDGFYSATLIEDESGYQSETGNYIVDYSIIINKVTTERVIEI